MPTWKRAAASAIAIVTLSVPVIAVSPSAADQMQPSARTSAIPEAAVSRIEQAFIKTLADPEEWSGAWYDRPNGRVVAAVKASAKSATKAEAREVVGGTGDVLVTQYSAAGLISARDRRASADPKSMPGVVLTGGGIDWEHNGLNAYVEKLEQRQPKLCGKPIR